MFDQNQISIVRRRLGISEEIGSTLPRVSHIDGRDSEGCTALSAAARGGHLDVINLLLDNGCSISATNAGQSNGGDTALHTASKCGREVVSFNELPIFLHFLKK